MIWFHLVVICQYLCAGTTACIGCPQGTFASDNGSTFCSVCPLGSFGVSVAASSCSSCWSEATESCNSLPSVSCVQRCSTLQFRVHPARKSGEYLCRYGSSILAPEFLCIIPLPDLKQKISCDYEALLLCKNQSFHEDNTISLSCESSMST